MKHRRRHGFLSPLDLAMRKNSTEELLPVPALPRLEETFSILSERIRVTHRPSCTDLSIVVVPISLTAQLMDSIVPKGNKP